VVGKVRIGREGRKKVGAVRESRAWAAFWMGKDVTSILWSDLHEE